jgi:hypothetical protein
MPSIWDFIAAKIGGFRCQSRLGLVFLSHNAEIGLHGL